MTDQQIKKLQYFQKDIRNFVINGKLKQLHSRLKKIKVFPELRHIIKTYQIEQQVFKRCKLYTTAKEIQQQQETMNPHIKKLLATLKQTT